MAGWLPRGRTLSDEAWAQRHRWMLWLLCANAAGVLCFALAQGYAVGHSLVEAGVVAAFAVLGVAGRHDRRLGSGAVAVGLLTASAATVHLSEGAIEAQRGHRREPAARRRRRDVPGEGARGCTL